MTIDEKRLTEIERLSGDFPHVAQLTAEIRRLWLERDVWRKAAQTMTPQGSEFTTAQACLDHNRRWRTEQQESTIRAHGKANAAEALADRMAKALRELFPEPVQQPEGWWLDSGIDGNLDGVLEDVKAGAVDKADERTLEDCIQRLIRARAALAAEEQT